MRKKYLRSYSEVGIILGISRQRVLHILHELEGKCHCGKKLSKKSIFSCESCLNKLRKSMRKSPKLRKIHRLDRNINLRSQIINLLTKP